MKNILVVEDSDIVTKVLRHLLQQLPDYQAVYAKTTAEAQAQIARLQNNIFAAIVDFSLPDAPNGEAVDTVLSEKIPTIVLTSGESDSQRELLLTKNIVDYITKEDRDVYSKAIGLIERLEKNRHIKAMVVDGNDISRNVTVTLFKRYLFDVIEARDGMEAVKLIIENPDIKLLATEFDLPRMNGVEIVRHLRQKYAKTDLAIIGLCEENKLAVAAKFIKNGVNYIIKKPFQAEEFYCCIMQCVELLEASKKHQLIAHQDQLTSLYHRQYFFSAAQEHYTNAQEKSSPIALAIINLDHFSTFNDNYGHEWGDFALKQVAKMLASMFDRFLLCRADNDNFYVLLPGLDNEKAVSFISRVRQLLCAEGCEINGESVRFYFSAGVSNKSQGGIDHQIKKARHLLQLGKEAGGNMVLGDDDEESN